MADAEALAQKVTRAEARLRRLDMGGTRQRPSRRTAAGPASRWERRARSQGRTVCRSGEKARRGSNRAGQSRGRAAQPQGPTPPSG
jgi:hypothetical protein